LKPSPEKDVAVDEQTRAFLSLIAIVDVVIFVAVAVAFLWMIVTGVIAIWQRFGWIAGGDCIALLVVVLSLAYHLFFRSRLQIETVKTTKSTKEE
jgi:uncharacterized membrane protein YcjF (UPF0283 family)